MSIVKIIGMTSTGKLIVEMDTNDAGVLLTWAATTGRLELVCNILENKEICNVVDLEVVGEHAYANCHFEIANVLFIQYVV